MTTPAGKVNINQGSEPAKLTAPMSRVSFVRLSARRGVAANARPSPTLEIEEAANCNQ